MNRISVRGVGFAAASMAALSLSSGAVLAARAPSAVAADSQSAAGLQITDTSPDIRGESAAADLVRMHDARHAVARATAQRAAALRAAHSKKVAAQVASRRAAAARASRTHVRPVAPGTVRALGRSMAAARGWTGSQFVCLDNLWTRESGWRTNAYNPGSGAYGIAQANPGSKMASVGSDYRTNPATQIAWGLSYIAGKHGNPCGAWSFWLGHHWY
ncbi:MAG: aggregation-promoting factor C-terminal-like domain-containing protein [Actinomycetes bacterium]